MPTSDEVVEQFCALSRQEWRAWLEKNHATAPGVYLVYYKNG